MSREGECRGGRGLPSHAEPQGREARFVQSRICARRSLCGGLDAAERCLSPMLNCSRPSGVAMRQTRPNRQATRGRFVF